MYKDGFQFIKGPGAAPADFYQRPAQMYKDTPILIEDTTPTDSPIGESPEHEEEKDMTTNGRVGSGNGAKADKSLGSFLNPGTDDLEDYQAAIDLALEKGALLRAAGNANIKQRHEGWLHRENADDRRRIDGSKANHDRKIMSGEHLNELIQLAVAAQECVMDYVEYQEKRNEARPASVQPLGEALIKASVQVITREYIEQLKLNAEAGNQEIILATPPGQRQQ